MCRPSKDGSSGLAILRVKDIDTEPVREVKAFDSMAARLARKRLLHSQRRERRRASVRSPGEVPLDEDGVRPYTKEEQDARDAKWAEIEATYGDLTGEIARIIVARHIEVDKLIRDEWDADGDVSTVLNAPQEALGVSLRCMDPARRADPPSHLLLAPRPWRPSSAPPRHASPFCMHAQGDISMVEFRIATHQLGLSPDVSRLDALYSEIDAKPLGNGDGWVDLSEMNVAITRWVKKEKAAVKIQASTRGAQMRKANKMRVSE